jgi:hypothetical protein
LPSGTHSGKFPIFSISLNISFSCYFDSLPKTCLDCTLSRKGIFSPTSLIQKPWPLSSLTPSLQISSCFSHSCPWSHS